MSFLKLQPIIATFEVDPIILADDSYGSLNRTLKTKKVIIMNSHDAFKSSDENEF
jgi:hypothetical protein